MSYWKKRLAGIVVLAGAAALWLAQSSRTPVVSAQVAHNAPIHGYVAAVLSQDTPAATVLRSSVINVPDIDVFAKNVKTGAVSNKVRTNPAGYFQTPALPPGDYQICVSGPGYVSSCDPQAEVVLGSIRVLDHVVPIRPATRALVGTVYLADKVTPCFWFRPAFDSHAVFAAKVTLIDTTGNVVAGPVNGNSLGQYVLPAAAAPGTFKVRATCEAAEGADVVKLGAGPLLQNIVIKNNAPQIVSLELSKGTAGVRRANPGDVLRASVEVTDLDGDTLHYQWVDDSGRSLGLPDAPAVDWPLINGRSVNTLRVQVSDGKGGFAVAERSLRAGPNEILFAGTVFNRQNHAPLVHAQVSLNNVGVQTDAGGRFQVAVPDAPRFVLNVNKSGFALSSRVYYGRNTGLQIPLDPVKKVTVNAGKGGQVTLPPDECERKCKSRASLSLTFEPGSLVDAKGKPYTGVATLEAFQYDISLPNPIPGDQGAKFQGKTVRLSTFGAFYLQPRNALGQPLKMAPNKKVKISMPIEPDLLARAPAKIPFFSYDEGTGMWTEHGTLTRAGDRYLGAVTHFSAFNADTQFAGSSCVKVILDPASFTLPVELDASYVDPSSGVFYHNGTQATDNPVGVERMTPNVNFTLEIHDASTHALLKSVTLNSGPPLDPAQFPDGLVSDPNFDACNGPVTIYNNNVPTGPTFLLPVTGGSIQDNSTVYQANTHANPGDTRDTFPHWLQQNGFPDAGDAHAIYFNNGDLKFGRDMHCRVTAAGITACYVSNFGIVGTDDSVSALNDARSGAVPVATVAMEYDPSAPGGENVQFWAYKGNGDYLAKPTLDGQGAKPMPDLCLACHGGYFNGTRAANAVFLPFDLDSFVYDPQGDPHPAGVNHIAVQEQFRRLNAAVLNTHPDTSSGDTNAPFTQLMGVWYPGGVNNVNQLFSFGTGAAQIGNFTGHEPLYDNVVKVACRTCHITRSNTDDWTRFSAMNTLKGVIQGYACGSSSPAAHTTFNFAMPHAEVPFKLFWQSSLSSTLDSELSLGPPHCPNQ